MTDLCADYLQKKLIMMQAPEKILVAVSGGRDSMVLASLCCTLMRKNGLFQFTFATVDHGLRSESANEAAFVSNWCKELKAYHETLIWQHDHSLKSGLQKRARMARYQLLLSAAMRLGCGAILTAHTLTDQAETVFMRLARGSGVAGIGAMREERFIAVGPNEPIRLMRPLLEISRKEITQYAGKKTIEFFDDPSNAEQKYERVRTRKTVESLQQDQVLSEQALGRTALRCQKAYRVIQTQIEQDFTDCAGVFHAWGGISFERSRLAPDQIDTDRLARMMARAIYAVGAKDYPPEEDAVFDAINQAFTSGQSPLGGAMMIVEGANVWVIREAGDLWGRESKSAPEIMSLAPDALGVWDRRFIIRNHADRPIEIGLIDQHNIPLEDINGYKLFSGPKSALHSVPIIKFLPTSGKDTSGKEMNVYAGLPNALPAGCDVKLLMQERFNGHVIRYF